MTDHEEYVKLGWDIIKYKYYYYELAKPLIEDYDYDMIERRYCELADKLGLPKSASEMVGFDRERPSCQLVMSKCGGSNSSKPKRKKKKTL